MVSVLPTFCWRHRDIQLGFREFGRRLGRSLRLAPSDRVARIKGNRTADPWNFQSPKVLKNNDPDTTFTINNFI